VKWYVRLRNADLKQLTSAQIRKELFKGQALFSRIEAWFRATEPTVVRDYVLSIIDKIPLPPRLIGAPRLDWKRELANVRLWQSAIADAPSLVRSDRGRPENYPLTLLVQDLARIWDAHAKRPFTN